MTCDTGGCPPVQPILTSQTLMIPRCTLPYGMGTWWLDMGAPCRWTQGILRHNTGTPHTGMHAPWRWRSPSSLCVVRLLLFHLGHKMSFLSDLCSARGLPHAQGAQAMPQTLVLRRVGRTTFRRHKSNSRQNHAVDFALPKDWPSTESQARRRPGLTRAEPWMNRSRWFDESFLVEVPGSTSPTGHGDPETRTPAGESFLVEVPGSTSPAGHHKTYRLESSGIYTGEAPDQRHVGHQKPLTRLSRQLLGYHVVGRHLKPATVNYCKLE